MANSEIGNIHPYRDVPREGAFKWSFMNVVILPILFLLKIGFTALVCFSGFLFFRDVVWYHDYDGRLETESLDQCQRNLSTMAQGLEVYHQAHGQYPQNQYQLIPDFLAKIPTCPASDRDGYRTNFGTSKVYTIYCADNQHHRLITATPPQLSGPKS